MFKLNGEDICRESPPDSEEIPAKYLPTARQALDIMRTRILGKYRCDEIFSSLPGGKSLRDLYNGLDIWINYDPSNDGTDYGWTMPDTFPYDIVITQYTLRMGRWCTLGTIVHELAHLNGAPGGDSTAAEDTLKSCGLRSRSGPYEPGVKG
jgi:hypothetical protein